MSKFIECLCYAYTVYISFFFA